MRRICTFVPAATATAAAPGTTANAHSPTRAQRQGVAKPAGVAVGSRAGRAILRAARNGVSAGVAPPFARGSTRQGPLAAEPVAVESIGSPS
jgi:hypothetical protein